MKLDTNVYGLLLQHTTKFGTRYLTASVVRRKNDASHPLNCSDNAFSEDRPEFMQKFQLDGLQMRGFISTGMDKQFIGWEPNYYDVYSIHPRDAKRMVTTFKAIEARVSKDAAYHDPIDSFMSLCAALKLEFVVECKDKHPASGSYADSTWRWMSIAEGRNRYRQMIADMLKQAEAA
jgi:hypothetical protein